MKPTPSKPALAKRINIIQRENVFQRFIFRIEEVKVEYERYDGSMSGEVTRLIFERGDSIAVLLHDAEKDHVLLCEQFRAPTMTKDSGWLVELPAGVVEASEEPMDCARRETIEETGYAPRILRPIARFYLSPGGSSERIHLFYAEVSLSDQLGAGGGVVEEGEDIRIIQVPVSQAFAQAAAGEIIDAKTLIAIQWLELQRGPGSGTS